MTSTSEEQEKRKNKIALVWMLGLGFLTVVIFGYCNDTGFFHSWVDTLSKHRWLECDSDNPCSVSHWRCWEMGAVIWSMLFGIYYYATFTAPDHGSSKLVCWIVIVLVELPSLGAGYLILFRQEVEWHVAAVLVSTCAFLWADATLFKKHASGSDQKRIFFESLLLADAPFVMGTIALLVYLPLHKNFNLDARQNQELDAFTGGAISSQLIASNVIFVVTQGDFLSRFWRNQGTEKATLKGAESVSKGNVSHTIDPHHPEAQRSSRPWGSILLAGCLLGLVIFAALAIFTFTPHPAIRALTLVPEIFSEKANSNLPTALALSPDGASLAHGLSDRGKIKIFSVWNRDKEPVEVEDEAPVHAVAFSSDGKTLASAAGKGLRVKLWNPKTGEQLGTLEAGASNVSDYVQCLEFSSERNLLAAGTHSGAIKVWDLNDLGGVAKWSLPLAGSEVRARGEVLALAFSQNGSWLVSGGTEQKISLWDIGALEKGERIDPTPYSGFTASEGVVMSVAVTSDGNFLAAGTQGNKIWLWDTGQTNNKMPTEPTRFSPMTGHNGPVRALRFSDDGSILASASENPGMIQWETQTGKHMPPIEAYSKEPTAMAFARTAWMLASASSDGTLNVWKGK